MRFIAFLLALLLLPLTPAHAGQAEAKELARNQNCQVASIVQMQAETGASGTSTYQVSCTLPGSMSEEARKANGLLTIRCDGTICSVIKKGE